MITKPKSANLRCNRYILGTKWFQQQSSRCTRLKRIAFNMLIMSPTKTKHHYLIMPILVLLAIAIASAVIAFLVSKTSLGKTSANLIVWFVIFFVLFILLLQYLSVFVFYGRLRVEDNKLYSRGFLYKSKSVVDLNSLSNCLYKKRVIVGGNRPRSGYAMTQFNFYYTPARLVLQDSTGNSTEIFTAGWTGNRSLMRQIGVAVNQAQNAQVDSEAKRLLENYAQ
jgi:hypothetical protein